MSVPSFASIRDALGEIRGFLDAHVDARGSTSVGLVIDDTKPPNDVTLHTLRVLARLAQQRVDGGASLQKRSEEANG